MNGSRWPSRRVRTLGAVAVAGALLAAGLTAPASADPDLNQRRKQVHRSLALAQEDLEDVTREMVGALQLLADAQAQLPGATQALAAASARLSAAEQQDAAAAADLAAAEAAERKAERQVAGVAARMASRRAFIASVARTAYASGGYAELSVVLDASSADDLAGRLSSVESVLRSETTVLDRLREDQADLADGKAVLAAQRQQTAAARKAAAAQLVRTREVARETRAARDAVERLINSRNHAANVLAAERAAELRRVAALQAQDVAIQNALARRAAAAAAARARAILQARNHRRAAPRFLSTSGPLSRPIPGARITSGYGWRIHPIFHIRRFHDGIDFGAACGEPIRAADDGVVAWTQWRGGYGRQTAIDHGLIRGRDVVTTYNHQSAFLVRPGQRVRRGQIIGRVGSTGFSTGCHLHLSVYVNGIRTNPAPFL